MSRPGTSGPARKPAPGKRERHAVRLGIGLAMAARVMRSHRVQEKVIVVAIGAAALVRLAQENQARTFTRLVAWDNRQSLRQRRKARAA